MFQYKGWPAHLSLLTRNTFHPFETVIDRLGIGQETKETVDRERALANLREALENGSPAVVWADIFSLAHTNLPSHPNIWATMPMLVHAFDGKCFHIADRSKVSIAIPVDELMDARARVKKDRFRMPTLSAPDPKKLREAASAGIRQCIQLFDGVGAPKGHAARFGFAGFQEWVEMLVNERNKQSWARVFPDGAGLFQALAGRSAQPGVFIWIMTFGAAPDAERGLFAEFLEDAAILLDQPKLAPSAKKFREIAHYWRNLAEAALPDRIPILRETRDLLLKQRVLYLEQGQAANAAQREIRAQLENNAKITAAALDPSSEEIRWLKRELRDRILQIHDAEKAAIAALATLLLRRTHETIDPWYLQSRSFRPPRPISPAPGASPVTSPASPSTAPAPSAKPKTRSKVRAKTGWAKWSWTARSMAKPLPGNTRLPTRGSR